MPQARCKRIGVNALLFTCMSFRSPENWTLTYKVLSPSLTIFCIRFKWIDISIASFYLWKTIVNDCRYLTCLQKHSAHEPSPVSARNWTTSAIPHVHGLGIFSPGELRLGVVGRSLVRAGSPGVAGLVCGLLVLEDGALRPRGLGSRDCWFTIAWWRL